MTGPVEVRPERPEDADTIGTVIRAAFGAACRSGGTEAAIVDALRQAGALAVSLVAVQDDEVVGHVAFSPVTVAGTAIGWFGLGPVSVRPERQGAGVGQALIRQGLDCLRRMDAHGCVVLGDQGYYGRFGFAADRRLRYGEAPPEYFLRLSFKEATPEGRVVYHPAFALS